MTKSPAVKKIEVKNIKTGDRVEFTQQASAFDRSNFGIERVVATGVVVGTVKPYNSFRPWNLTVLPDGANNHCEAITVNSVWVKSAQRES